MMVMMMMILTMYYVVYLKLINNSVALFCSHDTCNTGYLVKSLDSWTGSTELTVLSNDTVSSVQHQITLG
jgi:hypothetical protein